MAQIYLSTARQEWQFCSSKRFCKATAILSRGGKLFETLPRLAPGRQQHGLHPSHQQGPGGQDPRGFRPPQLREEPPAEGRRGRKPPSWAEVQREVLLGSFKTPGGPGFTWRYLGTLGGFFCSPAKRSCFFGGGV